MRALRKRGVTLYRDGRGESNLWQRRFWEHTIRDTRDLKGACGLCALQPGQARPGEKRSRLAVFVISPLRAPGMATVDWAGAALPERDFGEP